MDVSLLVLTFLAGLLGLVAFFVARALRTTGSGAKDVGGDSDPAGGVPDEGKKQKKPESGGSRRAAAKMSADGKAGKDKFSHPWLFTTLKGHGGRVLDMDLSENGKYLASSADDRAVLLWSVKEFSSKEHRPHRGNVAYDVASKVRWSPDSKAYLVHKQAENAAEVYRIHKREDGGGGFGAIEQVLSFPCRHETDVIGVGFAATGLYVMTCSDKTTLIIWSIRGEVLATVDTYHMTTYCAKVSPCGRFVATSGFTPDVKVWEVKFQRTGEFDKISRAFELTGHTSGVFHFDFNLDSSRMVTLSKDNTWRLYDTKVEFEKGQDPSPLQRGSFMSADETSIIKLSPDAEVIIVAHHSNISWFSGRSGDVVGMIESAHTQPLTCLLFDKEGRWLLSSGDKHIRIFHNVPGYRTKLNDLREKLRKANTEGMKDRLREQIEATEAKLKELKIPLK